MTLNEQQVNYLKDITDYILKFEEDMVIPHTMSEDIVWKARQLGYAMTESDIIWIRANKKMED